MIYKLNPFVREYTRGDITALFNALTLDTVYLNSIEYKQCLDSPDTILLDKSIVVPCDFNAQEYFYNNTPDMEQPNLNVAYFLLTSSCNFRCKYCFVETRMDKKTETIMSEDTARKGLELLKRNVADTSVSIVFYGGEPLLKFDLIRFIVEKAKHIGLNANYVIVTNGSIMSDEIAEFFKNNDFEVGVSVDGGKFTHDEMRLDNMGYGTFDKISKTIELLIKHEVTPGISCTLSRHNMNNPLEIKSYLTKYKLPCVSYNLPAPNGNVVISDEDRKILVQNLMQAETELINSGILEDKVVDRRLRAFIEKNMWIRDCAAYGQQMVIMPNGKVGVCHGLWPDEENATQNSYYDLDVNYTGLLLEHPTWKEWGARTAFNMPACWNCSAISLCGGGCAKNAKIKHGTIWEVDTDTCILMKEVIPWIIWTYYDKVKNKIH